MIHTMIHDINEVHNETSHTSEDQDQSSFYSPEQTISMISNPIPLCFLIEFANNLMMKLIHGVNLCVNISLTYWT